jgi:GNAT superfamily N-acetyltransferase
MSGALTIERLARHPEVLPIVETWLEAEWPAYYGTGGRGSARDDARSFASQDRLPLGVVAYDNGTACGMAALKAISIDSHAHLSPWAAAGFVEPSRRRKGIGAQLLAALEREARAFGFPRIYCATSKAGSLLERAGWHLAERIIHEGQSLGIYSKAL